MINLISISCRLGSLLVTGPAAVILGCGLAVATVIVASNVSPKISEIKKEQ